MRLQRIPNTVPSRRRTIYSTRMRPWTLIFLLGSLALNGLPLPRAVAAVAHGNQGLQYGAVIDNTGNILLTDEALDKLATSGAGWLRINFRLGNGYFLDWTDTSAHGYSALDRYDSIVNSARARGLKVLGELSNEA